MGAYGTSGVYTAKVDSQRVVLTQKNATPGIDLAVKVTSGGTAVGEVGPVFNTIPYAAAMGATPAVFIFEVTKELDESDTLTIGTESYKGVTNADSIVTKITASSTKYNAIASGKMITLTQKVAASEVPKITVR